MRTLLLIFLFSLNTCFSLNLSSHILDYETNITDLFKPTSIEEKATGLDGIDCVYVINLDSRKEKWERTKQQLESQGVHSNRFSGVNGWDISQTILDDFWTKHGLDPDSPPIPRGKLGCILSHLSVIQDAYDRGYERIWIFQDDIQIHRNLNLMSSYIEQLEIIDPNWGLLFADLDMNKYDKSGEFLRALCITGVYRHNQDTMPEEWYLERENINEDFQKIRMRYGFHSVVVSRTGMKLVLNYFKHVILQTHFDIDIHFIEGMNSYGLRDRIVSNSSDWKISDSHRPCRSIEELPSPYNTLKQILPYNSHGWYANANEMEHLIKRHKPKTVVELGSWLGKSTRHIAKLLPDDGKVFAVDHWLGSVEHQSPERTDVQHLLPSLYEHFLSNVVQEYLTEKIFPLRMTTVDAVQKIRQLGIKIDLVYVDASHDEESVYKDLCNWYPFVKEHGILCGDDWSWGEGYPIRKAVTRFAKENGLRIETPSESFWILYEGSRRRQSRSSHK